VSGRPGPVLAFQTSHPSLFSVFVVECSNSAEVPLEFADTSRLYRLAPQNTAIEPEAAVGLAHPAMPPTGATVAVEAGRLTPIAYCFEYDSIEYSVLKDVTSP